MPVVAVMRPASPSASATTVRGMSHRMGERYVPMRRTATMPMVMSRRVMSAPSNADAMSAPKAGPPVTVMVSTGGVSVPMRSLSSLIVVAVSLLVSPTVMGWVISAALPSSLMRTRGGVGESLVVRVFAMLVRVSWSAGVRGVVSVRVATRSTVWVSASGNVARMSATWADSDEAGLSRCAVGLPPKRTHQRAQP